MKAQSYSIKGEKLVEVELPAVFAGKTNNYLLAQAVRVYEDRQHMGLAYAKTRGEVQISTRKIYKQKGTGGARHGAKSAPIFVGGGVAHGPKGIKKTLTLSTILRRKALESVLTLKAASGKVLVVNGIGNIDKTNIAGKLIKKLAGTRTNVLVVLSKENETKARILRNIRSLNISSFSNLNAYQVFQASMILLDSALLEKEKKSAVKKATVKKTIKKETKK